MNRLRFRQHQHGFSLLEILVAFSIMALALGILYQATGSSVRNVGDVDRYQRAVALGESLLALRDSVPQEGWNESGESAGFTWRVNSAPFPTAVTNPQAPPLHEISISIVWTDGERQREIDLSTLRPQRKPQAGGAIP